MTGSLSPWLPDKPGDEMLVVGAEFERDGIMFRVTRGTNCEGDKIISICTNGWVKPRLSLLWIIFRFKCGVEENNYGINGKVKIGAGWKFLAWRLLDTALRGWLWADECTKEEVKKKRYDNCVK